MNIQISNRFVNSTHCELLSIPSLDRTDRQWLKIRHGERMKGQTVQSGSSWCLSTSVNPSGPLLFRSYRLFFSLLLLENKRNLKTNMPLADCPKPNQNWETVSLSLSSSSLALVFVVHHSPYFFFIEKERQMLVDKSHCKLITELSMSQSVIELSWKVK